MNRAVLASMRRLTPVSVLQIIRATSPAACSSLGVTPTFSFLSERRHYLCTTHAPSPLPRHLSRPSALVQLEGFPIHSVPASLLSPLPQRTSCLREALRLSAPTCSLSAGDGDPPPPWSSDGRAFLATSARPGKWLKTAL